MDQIGQFLAQIDQKCIFWAKFGRFWAKYPNFYGRKQKYPISRKNPLSSFWRHPYVLSAGWIIQILAVGVNITQLFFFRYAELEEIELETCQRKYDEFLSERRKAHLTENQLCAADDKVFLDKRNH